MYLSGDPGNDPILVAGRLQTVYGMIRTLNGGVPLALLAQGAMIAGLAVITWLLWCGPARFALKAATFSVAALMASPWAAATDMAAIVVPVAFLAKDQMDYGLIRGEQTCLIALFGASIVILITLGGAPIGVFVMATLLGVILCRATLFRYADTRSISVRAHI
jgi:hypothetical protein